MKSDCEAFDGRADVICLPGEGGCPAAAVPEHPNELLEVILLMGAVIIGVLVAGCIAYAALQSVRGRVLRRQEKQDEREEERREAEEKTPPAVQPRAADKRNLPIVPRQTYMSPTVPTVAVLRSSSQETYQNPVAQLPATDPGKLFSCIVNGTATRLTEQQIFDACNVDGSSRVTEAALAAQLSSLQWSVSAAYIRGVWMVYDADGDG